MSLEAMRQRLELIRHRIDAAAQRSGRSPESVRLIAVSKTQPVERILEAYQLGLRHFGENYVQEWRDKAEQLPHDICWHLIGPVQSKKARFLAQRPPFLMHTIDRHSIVDALEQRLTDELAVLIEVELGDEGSKSGVHPEQLPALVNKLDACSKLRLRGLMSIPPFLDSELLRPFHRRLAKLLETLNLTRPPEQRLELLSMGMSSDFEVAIEEGASLVRVGTALFGDRSSSSPK